jgi:hypothetical protein
MNCPLKKSAMPILLWVAAIAAVLTGAGRLYWLRTFDQYPLRELISDVRAGLATRGISEPEARMTAFLAARYGPLTEAANRQRAFLAFYDVEHTKALDIIASRGSASQKQADTQALGHWIAQYRKTMSPEERAALRTYLKSEAGSALLQRSTTNFLAQPEPVRQAQRPIMVELTTTAAILTMR